MVARVASFEEVNVEVAGRTIDQALSGHETAVGPRREDGASGTWGVEGRRGRAGGSD